MPGNLKDHSASAAITFREKFGLDTARMEDAWEFLHGMVTRTRFQFGLRSVGLFRPDLSFPAYLGRRPADRLAPIYNLFDRSAAGERYTARVSRENCIDFRGGRLSYDEHSGVDFVCPIGTRIVAAAPGRVAMVRRRFLRGGTTVAVDHGGGLLTQYTHCSRALVIPGQGVSRGETIALSGAAGYDLVQFFPLIPPHVHFMVFMNGRPRDPFLARGEKPRSGTWLDPERPSPSGPLDIDRGTRMPSLADKERLVSMIEACKSPRIRGEAKALLADEGGAAALLEDALHHDSWAWPREYRGRSVRGREPGETGADFLPLTLPFSSDDYDGARFGDLRWTRPLFS